MTRNSLKGLFQAPSSRNGKAWAKLIDGLEPGKALSADQYNRTVRAVESQSETMMQREMIKVFRPLVVAQGGKLIGFDNAIATGGKKGTTEYRRAMVLRQNRILMGAMPGFPDMVAFDAKSIPGFIEAKTETGVLRPDQKDFRDFCIAAGWRWAMVRSLDDLGSVLVDWIGIRWRRTEQERHGQDRPTSPA